MFHNVYFFCLGFPPANLHQKPPPVKGFLNFPHLVACQTIPYLNFTIDFRIVNFQGRGFAKMEEILSFAMPWDSVEVPPAPVVAWRNGAVRRAGKKGKQGRRETDSGNGTPLPAALVPPLLLRADANRQPLVPFAMCRSSSAVAPIRLKAKSLLPRSLTDAPR